MTAIVVVIALVALIVAIMPAARHRGLIVDDDEQHAGLRQKFVGNLLILVLGLPGLFFVVGGILRTTLATDEAIRSAGPWWILIGVALSAVCITLRNRVLLR